MGGKRKNYPTSRTVVKQTWSENPPSRFLDYKDFLVTLHDNLKAQNPKYTYSELSKDLGFESESAAYVILHGFRKLTSERAENLAECIGLSGGERKYFLALVAYTNATDESLREKQFQELVAIRAKTVSETQGQLLEFFSHWHHAAIFELVSMPDFRSDSEWIAKQFYKHLTPEQARKSLELLERLDLIVYDAQAQKHVKKRQDIAADQELGGLAIVGFHLQMMELGKAALSSVAHTEREISALTLSVDEALAERLKNDLLLFKKYSMFLANQCQSADRIVQLNLQFFPLTKRS